MYDRKCTRISPWKNLNMKDKTKRALNNMQILLVYQRTSCQRIYINTGFYLQNKSYSYNQKSFKYVERYVYTESTYLNGANLFKQRFIARVSRPFVTFFKKVNSTLVYI